MKKLDGQKLLAGYAGLLTLVVTVALLSGFTPLAGRPHFEEIDVQRINIVEPDGRLRMTISNNDRFPGIILHGHEYADQGRKNNGTAGVLFFDAEESESGGLIFGGLKDAQGQISRFGHLSFDQYDQDQMFTLDAEDNGQAHGAGMATLDQPSWPIEEYLQLLDCIKDLPPDQQQAAIQQFLQTHPLGARRTFLGRQADNSTALELRDSAGRVRAQMRVGADGAPVLQFLDENGQVTHQYPPA